MYLERKEHKNPIYRKLVVLIYHLIDSSKQRGEIGAVIISILTPKETEAQPGDLHRTVKPEHLRTRRFTQGLCLQVQCAFHYTIATHRYFQEEADTKRRAMIGM